MSRRQIASFRAALRGDRGSKRPSPSEQRDASPPPAHSDPPPPPPLPPEARWQDLTKFLTTDAAAESANKRARDDVLRRFQMSTSAKKYDPYAPATATGAGSIHLERQVESDAVQLLSHQLDRGVAAAATPPASPAPAIAPAAPRRGGQPIRAANGSRLAGFTRAPPVAPPADRHELLRQLLTGRRGLTPRRRDSKTLARGPAHGQVRASFADLAAVGAEFDLEPTRPITQHITQHVVSSPLTKRARRESNARRVADTDSALKPLEVVRAELRDVIRQKAPHAQLVDEGVGRVAAAAVSAAGGALSAQLSKHIAQRCEALSDAMFFAPDRALQQLLPAGHYSSAMTGAASRGHYSASSLYSFFSPPQSAPPPVDRLFVDQRFDLEIEGGGGATWSDSPRRGPLAF